MSQKQLRSEAERWEYYRALKRETSYRRGAYTRAFNRMFPKKHGQSLRDLIENLGGLVRNGNPPQTPRFRDLAQIHPDSFAIIAQYGVDYTPYIFSTRPESEPKKNGCFENAYGIMRAVCEEEVLQQTEDSKLNPVYVEGFAFGPRCPMMLHAWNAPGTGSRRAFDWTFYAETRWIRYFGIPLMLSEHEAVMSSPGTYSSIFHRKWFSEERKTRLLEILTNRT